MDARDARAALEGQLGRPVLDSIWTALLEEGDFAGMVEDGSVRDLKDEYLREERLQRRARQHQLTQRPVSSAKTDLRWEALAAILAHEASERSDVQMLRREALGGQLLLEDNLLAWLKLRANTADEPQHNARRGFRKGLREALAIYFVLPSAGGVERIYVGQSPSLGRLKRITSALTHRYSWTQYDAVRLVLCGMAPDFPPPIVETDWRPEWEEDGPPWAHAFERRVRLDVNALLPPEDVTKLFIKARSSVLNVQRSRPIRNMRWARLGVFVATHNDGRTWREAMLQWNREFPQFHYSVLSTSSFTKDGCAAYKDVMGQTLRWRGSKPRRGATHAVVWPQ